MSKGIGFRIAGVALVWLAASNAALALSAGTCTQGDASQLAGGFISAPLYALGFAMVWFARLARRALLWLAPAVPVIAWHSYVASRLDAVAIGGFSSACGVLRGAIYNDLVDGDEALYAVLWSGMSIGCWVALGLVVFRRDRSDRRTVVGAFD